MAFKAIMAPFWSSILTCDIPDCGGAFGSIREEEVDVRQEATARGWTCDNEADRDICSVHQEA
jgi:hypothetical protein